MYKMAGVGDWFTIGSVVACKTCYNKVIEGEVLAFDPQTKMLILKCPASSGRPAFNDVFVVNLSLVSDVQVKKEGTPSNEPMQSLNLARLNTRLRNQVEHKKRLISALQAGVSPEGQKLFLTISKTINDVTWQGQNIFVFSQVTVTPPYKPENVKGDVHSKAYTHIRKIVEKHLRDTQMSNKQQQQQQENETKMAAGSPASSVVASSASGTAVSASANQ